MHAHSTTNSGHVSTVRTPGAFWSVDIVFCFVFFVFLVVFFLNMT